MTVHITINCDGDIFENDDELQRILTRLANMAKSINSQTVMPVYDTSGAVVGKCEVTE